MNVYGLGEIFRFLLSGMTATTANFVFALLIRTILPVQGQAATTASVTCGFLFGTAVSFVLNRHFTFRIEGAAVEIQCAKFFSLAFMLSCGAGFLASELSEMLGSFEESLLARSMLDCVAHAITIFVMIPVTFCAMKYVAFAGGIQPGQTTGESPER